MKVSFLGLGNMGKNIALNLIRSGFEVTVWNRRDVNWQHISTLVNSGARSAETIREAVKNADFVGLSLTSDSAVRDVLEKVYTVLKKDAVVIDHSTISPACAREMAGKLAQVGVNFLDAPVSGGVEGAREAGLTVMVGGLKSAFNKAEPILKAMCKNFHYMGSSGSGQVTKLINQLLTGVNQATVCEAMILGETSGLNLNKLYDVLSASWGSSRMLERSVLSYIIPKHYESAACLELMNKDFELTIDMAKSYGYFLPMTETAKHFYEEAINVGMGKMDHSYIIEIMKKENNIANNNQK